MCANVDQTGIYVGSEKILQYCFSPYFILDIPGVTLTVIISTLGLCLNKTEGSSGENKLTNHRPTGTLKIFFEDYQRHKSLTPSLKLVQCTVIRLFWCTSMEQTTCFICNYTQSLQFC